MSNEGLRAMLSAATDNNSGNGNGETEPKAKAKRGRRAKGNTEETAIAKSEGHKLANQQQAETAELLAGLAEQERALTAYHGYQEGQDFAKLRLAARTAGMTDVLVGANLDRIDALRESLKNNLETHNPISLLDDLGLNRSPEETQELRERAQNFNADEFNRFLF